ncbi:MAG: hypothetical protein MUE36_12305 [Acidimicrobiales bacterium]|nr:hypothetical protein [Acidimicrobiales bacterium]
MAPAMTASEALATAGTGDVWLFRGPSGADRAIRVFTNAPVNHVAMVVALDDLPPLLWHTELGQSLESVWSGDRHRGAQLNRLDEALDVWTGRYSQSAFVRHLDAEITPRMEDDVLRVVAEYEGRPFPRTRRLVGKWLSGRLRRDASEQAVYCAELLAITYTRMGLLDGRAPANWFDPGRFWSGDRLDLVGGAVLGPEVPVAAPT